MSPYKTFDEKTVIPLNFNPLNRLRLLTKYRQEPFLSFRRVLGFMPRHIELYRLAVRHRSAPVKNAHGGRINNERLEFLGDAVLNSIVSDLLYRKYPDEKEGFLTNARSNIVKRDSLNKICRKIGLNRLIVADKSIGFKKEANIYGNALEALVGAVYLDVGYRRCAKFVQKRLLVSTKMMRSMAEDNENYKSELLEWCQQRYYTLNFQLLDEVVDARNRHTFVSQALVRNCPAGTGSGSSKKESHQQAAKRTLEMIRADNVFEQKLRNWDVETAKNGEI